MPLRRTLAAVASVCAAAALAAGLAVRVETHPRIRTTLLWSTDIAPILQRRCYQCHAEGTIAMSLATYREGRPWAAAIREEVLRRRMPPWSAVQGYGHFSNDPSLTPHELDLLVAWADGGAPSGQLLADEAHPAVHLHPPPDWTRGTPDAVLRPGTPARIPAGAAPFVARVDVATGFTRDRRVDGLAFNPGDRRVVRYAVVTEKASGRWLFTWTPWQSEVRLPAGTAFSLPAGAVLTIEIAYRGADTDVSDASEVGLYLAPETAHAATTGVLELSGVQPLVPGAEPVRFRAEETLAGGTTLLALWPEPGEGARSVEVTAVLPDGGVRPLLWLKDYRADFRAPYVFTDPLALPRGTRLLLTVYAGNATAQPVDVRPRLSFLHVPARTE